MFDNKTLMITGGTGSFGKAVLKLFLSSSVREIRIFSRDEKKQEDLRLSLGDPRVKFYIGDVRDFDAVNRAFSGVNYVFHAAALKQVPSCEFYPMEAFKTNVIGTDNVIKASLINKIKKVVFLSTDKAVYPINAMGISKAMAEKVLVATARTLSSVDTVLCATRYGNVMASRGSVIPLFVSQLIDNKPLTITDPEMTRFIMSLDESVDLVKKAFLHGEQGDIFVRKSPAATVGNIALALSRIFEKKLCITTIGTRHGEKLYESLISREEMARAQDLGGFFRIPADGRDLDYAKYFNEGEKVVSVTEDYTSHNAERLCVDELVKLLEALDYIRKKNNA